MHERPAEPLRASCTRARPGGDELPEAHAHTAGARERKRRGIPLGSVRGIGIRAHWSLLAVLPFFAAILAFTYFPVGAGLPLAWSLVWGTLLAVLLFASVLVHELSHSFMALRFGITVRGIVLLPIGGISQMEKMPERPGQELAVSVVGPLTNFVLAAPLLAVALLGLVPAVLPGLPAFVLWAGVINVALGVFNMFLPAFPMDGGRMLRALLATRLGRVKATKAAAATGRALALLMGLVGILTLGIGGILLIVVAFFVYMGAGAEEQMVINEETLSGMTVADLMTREPVTLHPEDTMEVAFHTMSETKHLAFPVIDADAHIVGCIGLPELAQVDPSAYATTHVSERMRDDITTMEPRVPAAEALTRLTTHGDQHIAIVVDGRLEGFLTRTDIERRLEIERETHEREG